MPILFLKRTREDLILRILLPSLPSHPSLPRDEWVFKGQVRKQSRPNMAASWTTGFLGIVFARAGSLTYIYIYAARIFRFLRFASSPCMRSVAEEARRCNANSRYNCGPFTARLTSIPRFKNVPTRRHDSSRPLLYYSSSSSPPITDFYGDNGRL